MKPVLDITENNMFKQIVYLLRGTENKRVKRVKYCHAIIKDFNVKEYKKYFI